MGSGVEVLALEDGAPADRGGIEIEDVIVAFGDETVESVDDLHKFLTNHPVNEAVTMTVLRDGRRVELKLTPTAYPALP
jgi:S1-C subfamily serine protease